MKYTKNIIRTLCIGTALLALTACKEEAPVVEDAPRPIRTFTVAQSQDTVSLHLPGRARAVQAVDLSFRVSGPLTERPVQVGELVAKGDLIAQIDPTDYRAEVERAIGGVEQAAAALARAKSEYARELSILQEDAGATSTTAVNRKREARDRAQASRKSAQAVLDNVRNQLRYASLRAPFAGRVVSTYVENFETVQAKQPIARLLDNSSIKFDVDIPEQQISSVLKGEEVSVLFDAFPAQPLKGKVYEIATESSKLTSTYQVTLLLEQSAGQDVLAGMSGEAHFQFAAGAANRGVLIPQTALFSSDLGDKSFVWLVDSNNETVHKQPVQVAGISEAGVDIISGLKAGDRIASAGVHFLSEGSKVRLLVVAKNNK